LLFGCLEIMKKLLSSFTSFWTQSSLSFWTHRVHLQNSGHRLDIWLCGDYEKALEFIYKILDTELLFGCLEIIKKLLSSFTSFWTQSSLSFWTQSSLSFWTQSSLSFWTHRVHLQNSGHRLDIWLFGDDEKALEFIYKFLDT